MKIFQGSMRNKKKKNMLSPPENTCDGPIQISITNNNKCH